MIRENITISVTVSLGYFEWRKLKPWFDEGCSKLVGQKKQAKLQWLQDTSEWTNLKYSLKVHWLKGCDL
jgi:hypothetical protein